MGLILMTGSAVSFSSNVTEENETLRQQNSIAYVTEVLKRLQYLQRFNRFKFFVCLHGDKTYNSFVCGNTT
jgi:hypothetical protein